MGVHRGHVGLLVATDEALHRFNLDLGFLLALFHLLHPLRHGLLAVVLHLALALEVGVLRHGVRKAGVKGLLAGLLPLEGHGSLVEDNVAAVPVGHVNGFDLSIR